MDLKNKQRVNINLDTQADKTADMRREAINTVCMIRG